jgi:ribosomal protein S27E
VANPLVIAIAIARARVTLTCPQCGLHKTVVRSAATGRSCSRCYKQLVEPARKDRR